MSGHGETAAAAKSGTAAGAQEQSFALQIEFLKLEFQAINEVIKRIDGITQTTKNWAVLIWAGSMSLSLGQPRMRHYVLITAVLPLPFWFVDGWWRSIQRSCIYRSRKISEFLNGPNLVESFKQQRLVDFKVLDVRSVQYEDMPEFRSFISAGRTMRFRDVGGFYLPLMMLSLLLGGALLFVPQLLN